MDSRKCQTATVTPAEPGDYLIYLVVNSLQTSGLAQIICKQELLSQGSVVNSPERPT